MTDGPRITLPDRDTVEALVEQSPEDVQRHIDHVKSGVGSIPWLAADAVDWESGDKARMLAHNPDIFELWWLEDYHTVKQGQVEPLLKELLGMRIASRIGCDSCLPYHEGAARYEGASDELIAAVRNADRDSDVLSDAQWAAIDFGVTTAFEPTEVTDDDVARLVEAGYDDAAIVELANAAFLAYRHAAINRALNLGQD